MGEGSLSQDEINALLQGADDASFSSKTAGGTGQRSSSSNIGYSPVDQEIILDLFTDSLNIVSDKLSNSFRKKIQFEKPAIERKTNKEIEAEFSKSYLKVTSNFSNNLEGPLKLLISSIDGKKIVKFLMSSDGNGEEMDSAELQTIKEVLGPILEEIPSQLTTNTGMQVSATPVDVNLVNSSSDLELRHNSFLKIQYDVNFDGLGIFKISFVIPTGIIDSILYLFKTDRSAMNQPNQGGGSASKSGGNAGNNQSNIGSSGQVGIKNVGFPSFNNASATQSTPNLNLLMDVKMSVTVELGRTKMYIKEILGLGEGSIIELEKLAGEPVDLLVNNKLIAKGEVVVIDENFGVRVTDIVSPADRIKAN